MHSYVSSSRLSSHLSPHDWRRIYADHKFRREGDFYNERLRNVYLYDLIISALAVAGGVLICLYVSFAILARSFLTIPKACHRSAHSSGHRPPPAPVVHGRLRLDRVSKLFCVMFFCSDTDQTRQVRTSLSRKIPSIPQDGHGSCGLPRLCCLLGFLRVHLGNIHVQASPSYDQGSCHRLKPSHGIYTLE